MSVSAVLYTNDTVNNDTVQEQQALEACVATETASTFTQRLKEKSNGLSVGYTETTYVDRIKVVSVYTIMRYPPVFETLPIRDAVVVSVWVSCLTVFCFIGFYAAYQRVGKRHKVKKRKTFLQQFM